MPGARFFSYRHEVGKDVRADRRDHAQAQRPAKLVLAAARDALDAPTSSSTRCACSTDRLARRGHDHLVLVALEERHAELVLELGEREGKRGLRDEALLRGAAEMALLGEGDDVASSVRVMEGVAGG
jgi:hypothetical protein